MKKLLFVATASLCATVFGAIESSNVVGYQNKTTVGGFNFVSPTFKNVSGGNLDIQDIKLTGDVTPWVDVIEVLGTGGETVETYIWDGTQWLEDDYATPATKTLAEGVSVLLNLMNDGVNVQFSGSVGKTKIETTSVAGFNFVGNATPKIVGIQGITLSGEVTPWVDVIEVLGTGGETVETYVWDGAQWLEDDYATPASRNLEAGEGFLLNVMNDGVVITVPAAL